MTQQPFFIIILVVIISACNNAPKNEHVDFERNITLEGQSNFRDLGNYQTKKGETIKTGLLYRSGTLAKLTGQDIEIIDSLQIKTVVNFLDEGERQKYREDKLPESVRSIYLPIEGENNEAATLFEARQTGDFSKVPVDFNYQIHAVLIEDGKEAYADLFHILADSNNYPVVFHCSHGVHRTGTASALILSLLRIPWDIIQEDYLLSNEFRKEESEERIKMLNKLAEESGIENPKQNEASIKAFYILQGEYIKGTQTAIQQNYGSIEQYLNDIGITNEEISNIQQILLK